MTPARPLIGAVILAIGNDDMTQCTFDPTPCLGGMFHCPECGDMVLAGVPHPYYSVLENMPPPQIQKLRCNECEVMTDTNGLLQAINPFDSEETIYGCPNCKSVNCFTEICDEPGCELESTCGTPTANKYRRTCGKHRPQ